MTAKIAKRPMNHEERLELIYRGFPPVTLCHSVKRWAGVFVDDYFGEGLGRLGKGQLNHRRKHGGLMTEEPATKFDITFYAAEYAEWERMSR